MKLIIFNFKLIVVLLAFYKIVVTFCLNYCDVCVNHTLCKYPSPGPSLSCKSYDTTSRLSNDDIQNVVAKMNERRNFVALGLSRDLPPAANMRKLKWSRKLAYFAQRWVDQCDTTVPGKEDECRDLGNIKVGQNIATIMGATTPGLNIRSFVEIWFMQTLDYTGSVSFYNQSQDFKANYFTQLIWADTTFVGCGKAKFFSESKRTTVQRLVCNFADKGNQHGKPVYSIGVAATQCPQNMGSDKKFHGLCRYKHKVGISTQTTTTVSSLLRILNLSNDTTKRDFFTTDWKNSKVKLNKSRNQRNQNIRHIFPNNPSGSMRDHQRLQNNKYNRPLNFTRGYLAPHHRHENSNSHILHHNLNNNFDFKLSDVNENGNPYTTKKYFGRPFESFSKLAFGIPLKKKPILRNRCTRKQHYQNKDGYNVIVQACSRAPNNNYCPPNCQNKHADDYHVDPHSFCPCTSNTQQYTTETTATITTPMPITTAITYLTFNTHGGCKDDCRCKPPECPTTACPRLLRKQLNQDGVRDSPEFYYYDILPKITFRSGDLNRENIRGVVHATQPWFYKMPSVKEYEPLAVRINDYNEVAKQTKDKYDYLQVINELPKDFYDYYDVRRRLKRNDGDELNDHATSDLKPFWQVDEFDNKNPSDLRSLRYTTLNPKKRRKSQRTTTISPVIISTSTEPITFMLKEIADFHNNNRNSHFTEKYLSFEELMRLRKLSTMYEDEFNFRRAGTTKKSPAKTTAKAKAKVTAKTTTKQAAKTTAKTTAKTAAKTTAKTAAKTTAKATAKETAKPAPISTSVEIYTMNTPFVKEKFCTRLLTCTWTALYVTGPDGSPITQYKGREIGSRTPPGYVEGCTRTSTCTRDFMERNVNEVTGADGEVSSEDEDYCERRSLNVHRRNSEVNQSTEISYSLQEVYTDTPMTKNLSKSSFNNSNVHLNEEINEDQKDCFCEVINRKKRQNSVSNDVLSYGDLFYLVLRKILQTRYGNKHKNYNCMCNASQKGQNNSKFNMIYLLFHYFILNDVLFYFQ